MHSNSLGAFNDLLLLDWAKFIAEGIHVDLFPKVMVKVYRFATKRPSHAIKHHWIKKLFRIKQAIEDDIFPSVVEHYSPHHSYQFQRKNLRRLIKKKPIVF